MPHLTQVYAHRGAKAVAPENTLPAFQKAIEMGVAGIELDTQATADGYLIVLHDFHLERTTTGKGLLRENSLAQLQGVDAGIHFHESFAGTPIPTLEEVFDIVGDRCRVNVEIKNMDWDGGPEVDLLVPMIQQRKLHEQVIVSSFNPITLLKMRWADPSIALGLLYSGDLPIFLRRAWLGPLIAPEALHPHHTQIDEAYMRWAASQGHYVNTWTINDPNEARRLAALGVDVIISDVPDVIIEAIGASYR
jgi:glycerophosphoryl diester phosphodiesterase